MANHKSAIKRIRQTERRRVRNRVIRGKLRTEAKAFVKAVTAHDNAAAKELLAKAIREVQKAGSKGVLHPNAVSRKVGRLAKAFNRLSGAVRA